jgi:hypothetical protein
LSIERIRTNHIIHEGKKDLKLIPLTKGYFAQVDDWWYDYLMQWKWHYGSRGYAVRAIYPYQKKLFMHRIINNTPDGFDTDHVDTNGLNNQSFNLRTATKSQNSQNRKAYNKLGVKGVSIRYGVYTVTINIEGKSTHIGSFYTLEKAKEAYAEASKKYHGEFGRT